MVQPRGGRASVSHRLYGSDISDAEPHLGLHPNRTRTHREKLTRPVPCSSQARDQPRSKRRSTPPENELGRGHAPFTKAACNSVTLIDPE